MFIFHNRNLQAGVLSFNVYRFIGIPLWRPTNSYLKLCWILSEERFILSLRSIGISEEMRCKTTFEMKLHICLKWDGVWKNFLTKIFSWLSHLNDAQDSLQRPLKNCVVLWHNEIIFLMLSLRQPDLGAFSLFLRAVSAYLTL